MAGCTPCDRVLVRFQATAARKWLGVGEIEASEKRKTEACSVSPRQADSYRGNRGSRHRV